MHFDRSGCLSRLTLPALFPRRSETAEYPVWLYCEKRRTEMRCLRSTLRLSKRSSNRRSLPIGNCDLQIDDILGPKSWNRGRPDVVDSNRCMADQVADVPRDLREVVGPVGLKANNRYGAGRFRDIEIRHSLETQRLKRCLFSPRQSMGSFQERDNGFCRHNALQPKSY